eukprot:TRINITY_DN2125_c0_g2_i2.p1 TRINITY_DN2125_c0_g2~~TRINITY_DN2125_c0_g2_i2.p1  ORF type:complete len:193 (+),score=41.93 TRINITY_DN2125_c0_g2_i2:670-1248(+)
MVNTLAVFLSMAGIFIITFFSNHVKEGNITQTVFGYSMVIVATLMSSGYEVGFKKFGADGFSQDASDSLLFLGTYGIMNLIFLWPLIYVWDIVGWESFVMPNSGQWTQLLYSAALDTGFNMFLLGGIYYSSPLLVSIGSMLTVPLSILLGWWLHNGYLPNFWVFSGMGAILIGFILMNVEEWQKSQRRSNRE